MEKAISVASLALVLDSFSLPLSSLLVRFGAARIFPFILVVETSFL